MAFGLTTTSASAAKTNAWATATARSTSLRRNNAARTVGAAVAATCKNKLRIGSPSKVSAFSDPCLSDASTVLSDDCMSSPSRSSTASSNKISSPTSLPGTPPNQVERGSSSSSSTCDGSLPGSLCADEECQPAMSRRERGSGIKRRPRSPDHFERITLELGEAAHYSSIAVREALSAVDKDKDGLLTESCMQGVFEHFGLPSSDASIFFNLMSQDSSGRICWREVIAILAPMLKAVKPKQDFASLSIQFKQEILTEDP